ncbi:hypothetical protein DERF_006655 [Dermatophagoides farinae]|uniref:Uncharacterized protein n=1 Tax=Dermatophagoides farinae TaxID=6954 RepID=A0A922I0L9_DERFA|nr:hypothetical protein DERF_006655 [Dermatophagoides farinae]
MHLEYSTEICCSSSTTEHQPNGEPETYKINKLKIEIHLAESTQNFASDYYVKVGFVCLNIKTLPERLNGYLRGENERERDLEYLADDVCPPRRSLDEYE